MSDKSIVKVSALVKKIDSYLAKHVNLSKLLISGEISNLRNVKGHLYFDLKDDQGQMACVMWRTHAQALNFEPKDGSEVLLSAQLGVYAARGSLQLVASKMELSGEGQLLAMLEERKRRLEAAGYFNPAHKKPRPAWFNKVAIVTGKNTAAMHDVLKTIITRWPMLEFTVFPALVQGERAPAEIIAQLRRADAMGFDAILLVRGGGSMEDLFCFNDEDLIKTIYDLNTYIVSGIGHEIDYTLADHAVDHRAVTPTAAAQWVTPNQQEVKAQIESWQQQMSETARRIFRQNSQALLNLQSSPILSNPKSWLSARQNQLESLQQAFLNAGPAFARGMRSQKDALDFQFQNAIQNLETGLSHRHEALHNQLLFHAPQNRIASQRQELQYLRQTMQQVPKNWIEKKQQELLYLQNNMLQAPQSRLASQKQELQFVTRNMVLQMDNKKAASKQQLDYMENSLIRARPQRLIEQEKKHLKNLFDLLNASSPFTILEKGYAIVYAGGHQIHSIKQTQPGEAIAIQLYDGSIQAITKALEPNPKKER